MAFVLSVERAAFKRLAQERLWPAPRQFRSQVRQVNHKGIGRVPASRDDGQ
jgi:hypothetical protein